MAFVALENVSLIYGGAAGQGGGTLAIEDTSLAIDEGQFVALVGPSGCGKSTVMKLVTGLVPATRGVVQVAGRAVRGPQKMVGMAFQNPTLLPWRTTLDNILLPLEIVEPYRSNFRSDRKQFERMAEELLATVGLAGSSQRFPWQLSGGMQQRASLCRALIHQPQLLMLDEPFAALDAFTREELWLVLRDLWEQKRFTVVLVTHDLREAVFLADIVHVMSPRPGRVIASRRVDLPRPRDLDVTYTPEFIDLVHQLREHIRPARQP